MDDHTHVVLSGPDPVTGEYETKCGLRSLRSHGIFDKFESTDSERATCSVCKAKGTLRERLVIGLKSHGWIIDEDARTRKYTVLKPAKGGPARYYVGRAGALRYSAQGTVTTAFPSNSNKKLILRKW